MGEGTLQRYAARVGETLTSQDGQKCWGVALGESRHDGLHVWRHFCVPISGGDVWVGKMSGNPDEQTVYVPYDKWVSECKPTAEYAGSC